MWWPSFAASCPQPPRANPAGKPPLQPGARAAAFNRTPQHPAVAGHPSPQPTRMLLVREASSKTPALDRSLPVTWTRAAGRSSSNWKPPPIHSPFTRLPSRSASNLNLILEGLNFLNSVVNQANTLKQSIRALRQAKNAQAAAAALNTVSTQVNEISSTGGFVQDTTALPQP